jgi:hypothetical protein
LAAATTAVVYVAAVALTAATLRAASSRGLRDAARATLKILGDVEAGTASIVR